MSIRFEDPLTYTNFGELIGIFDSIGADFSDTLRSQKAMHKSCRSSIRSGTWLPIAVN